MNTYTTSEAISIVRGREPDRSRDEINDAWQHLVNTGTVWNMGKWYSDMAMCLLASGIIERNAA